VIPWRGSAPISRAGRLLVATVAAMAVGLPAPAAEATTFQAFPLESAGAGPIGIITGPDGGMWVASAFGGDGGGAFEHLDHQGHLLSVYKTPPDRDGHVLRPRWLAPGPGTALWFAADHSGWTTQGPAVGLLGPHGEVQMEAQTQGCGTLAEASNLVAGSDRRAWYAAGSDATCHSPQIGARLIATAQDGTVATYPLPDPYSSGVTIRSIAAAPDGALWFVGQIFSRSFLARSTTTGSFTFFSPPGPLDPSEGSYDRLAASPDGSIWLLGDHELERFVPVTGITEHVPLPLPPGSQHLRVESELGLSPTGHVYFWATASSAISDEDLMYDVRPDRSVEGCPTGLRDETTFDPPSGLTIADDGNIWYTPRYQGVVRGTPDGAPCPLSALILPNNRSTVLSPTSGNGNRDNEFAVAALGDSISAGFGLSAYAGSLGAVGWCGTHLPTSRCDDPGQAWPTLVADALNSTQRRGRLIPQADSGPLLYKNYASSGSWPAEWTSGDLSATLLRVKRTRPDVVLLTLGANDLLGHMGCIAQTLLSAKERCIADATTSPALNSTRRQMTKLFATLLADSHTRLIYVPLYYEVPFDRRGLVSSVNAALQLARADLHQQAGRVNLIPAVTLAGSACHTNMPFMLGSIDACLHPSAAGQRQIADSVLAWMARPGRTVSEPTAIALSGSDTLMGAAGTIASGTVWVSYTLIRFAASGARNVDIRADIPAVVGRKSSISTRTTDKGLRRRIRVRHRVRYWRGRAMVRFELPKLARRPGTKLYVRLGPVTVRGERAAATRFTYIATVRRTQR
jgi:virginiamycin B lyase